jgi:hypothetical protein
MKRKIILSIVLLYSILGHSQKLQAGFNKEEYLELLRISVCSVKDTTYAKKYEKPKNYSMMYQSGSIGLDNSWDLWTNKDRIAVISLRGTTEKQESWLQNFYAAMVPAKGTLQLGKDTPFNYTLANDPKAAVHVGWLIGMAFLAKEIVPKIETLYRNNTKDFIIMGHSQGGAIAYLLTAYLYHLQQAGQLPKEIRFKTYCSAGPKPGNLNFAYEYESLTQNGWAYNIVNTLDWVPETPFSIQTLTDFNSVNPFKNAKKLIQKQKFPKNLALKYAYNRLDKPSRRAQRNYQKYLGEMTSKMVVKQIENLEVPAYENTNNYVRTGTTIVLKPDQTYREQFPDDDSKIFIHHMHDAYFYLTNQLNTPFYEK